CGPTCLHAVYGYHGEALPLEQVIAETATLSEGGTLGALLGQHALARGYDATIYTFNLRVFDPTWFDEHGHGRPVLRDKLAEQIVAKENDKLQYAGRAYQGFLEAGGELRMKDLTRGLIRQYLNRSIPIVAGLSSTFLYRAKREIGATCTPDDINGLPTGHFVVLCGYDRERKLVRIADPYLPNPIAPRDHYYVVDVDRVVCAILLGALTYDANLMIFTPGKQKGLNRGDTHRRQ
ncbi:MAG: C39 family peptidase, partial [Planctomycetota bacterium]